jgi:hypothetical protein
MQTTTLNAGRQSIHHLPSYFNVLLRPPLTGTGPDTYTLYIGITLFVIIAEP